MRFSGRRICLLVGAMGLVMGSVFQVGAQVNPGVNNKVIIYPTSKDSIEGLKQEGITNVLNYGSYWLVRATDDQVKVLKQRHGDRATEANYLNRIELRAATVDTTRGEPMVPESLRQQSSGGRDLRLIQFAGPIQPEWLEQVKAAGNVKIVAYIPNDAYVVLMDAAAEQKIAAMKTAGGPIQWLGPYHPQYKFDSALAQSSESTVKVRVGVADSSEADATIAALDQFNRGAHSQTARGTREKIVTLTVSPGDVPQIAQLPTVMWITQVRPMRALDESADLLMASRTNQLPGHAPVPGLDNYMDFLTNQVGFSTIPEEYPILDIADTLFSSQFNSDFFVLGNTTNESRSAGTSSLCSPSATLCGIHADWVTSVALGANISSTVSNEDSRGFRLGLGVSPFGRFANTIIFSLQGTVCDICAGDFSPANDFTYITLNQYAGHGARISNNSWGEAPIVVGTGGNAGMYDAESLAYDTAVRDALETGVATNGTFGGQMNQELITVFAVGNGGADDLQNGGFSDSTVVPPATAKNIITAGASENVRPALEETTLCGFFAGDADNSYDIAFFSTFGPTVDGRFKPDLVAPGIAIFALDAFSTILSSNFYDCVAGTSFSAPATSASVQLLWWYFEHRLQNEQGDNLLQPSPAMAKAYLCNSARYLPITNPQTGITDTLPSIAQGMGMLDLQRMFDGVPRILRDESTPRAIDTPLNSTNPIPQQTYFSRSGQSYQVNGQVADPTNPFRVTVAWTDPPGNPAAFKQLVNDLDLQVTIGGQTYKGNVFTGPNSVTGGSADGINNMESVFLPPGQTGTWSVVVRATDIAGNGVPNVGTSVGQDFALVVYNVATTNRSDAPTFTTNDACQTAMEIDTFPFTFTNALSKAVYHKTIPSPSAGLGGVQEFFKIEQPTPGSSFTIDTFGSSFDTVLSVWQVNMALLTVPQHAECGALQELVSNNDSGSSPQSSVSFTADGSNTYFIVVEPHNDGGGGTLVLNVNASASLVTLNPNSLAFGDQIQGTTSAVQTVTYQNGYSIPVTVTSVNITGSDPSDFTIISDTCAGNTLGTGTNCVTGVAFTPQATGTRQANLVFTDTATGKFRVVPLSGTGTPRAPVVCFGSRGGIAFTNTAVGVTSAPVVLTVTNCGTAPLTISGVTLSGSSSNDFSVVQTCTSAGSISPGGTCSLSVTFKPTAAGNRQANILIFNSTSVSPLTVTLQGIGFIPSPALCVSSSPVSFGSVEVGLTGFVHTVVITNCGTAALVISNTPTVTGANAGDFIVTSSTCTTVLTGQACTVSMQFAPTAGGVRSASLSITDNIAGSPQLIPLIGSGSLSQPDATIGKNTKLKKMAGGGVINTTGILQEISQNIHRGARKPVKFYTAVKNVGSGTDQFIVSGDGSSGGFTVNYYLGAKPADSVDVTAAVGTSTLTTSTLGAGAVTGDATMIRIEVFADKTVVAKGTTKTFTLTFTSASDPTKQDTVRATVVAR